ncbi:LlaJI family restriction endonuclease [Clostridium sardiniense]|uniref:LlaJI family restriction endonuclease n=1 Tax=Clostridium sardiniense TaxID=29369 RepID=A0ABS7KYZ1_CLOSR|nr:LlaJI family restriction endonuclease [Clostridium sardiniense]MBY0755862.1 LlaJI family restriction endonuclease [Clostridium sardiniense]
MDKLDLFKRCHVNTNDDGDRFVGVKVDENNAAVYFPIGYELPNTDQELRRDIINLISILAEFTKQKDKLISIRKFIEAQTVNFPINAYMTIIDYFMQRKNYYTETEQQFKVGDRGKTDWGRTIKYQRPIMQANGSPVYLQRQIRDSAQKDRNLITQIHEYCVYESFTKLGWLFTTSMPKKPTLPFQKNMFLSIVNDKLRHTFNDKDKRLFQSMIDMINYIDEHSSQKNFYFGTDYFEYVWEKLIDKAFGVKNKEWYFPRTTWTLSSGKIRNNNALEPDTIMVKENKIYILDAKYYRYGITGELKHLPESTSINKQITYGEYVHTENKFKQKFGENIVVYNAFLIPYNKNENYFNLSSNYAFIGEATGDWKSNGHTFEKVQGIVVDTRYLMYHYIGNKQKQIQQMVETIESAFINFNIYLERPNDSICEKTIQITQVV